MSKERCETVTFHIRKKPKLTWSPVRDTNASDSGRVASAVKSSTNLIATGISSATRFNSKFTSASTSVQQETADDFDYDDFDLMPTSCGGGDEEAERDYEVLHVAKLMNYMMQVIEEVRSITGFEVTVTRVLLNRFKWDKEQLLERYYGDEDLKNSVFDVLNSSTRECLPINSSLTASEDKSRRKVNCLICYSDDGNLTMFSSKCGHSFCSQCWSSYVKSKIEDGESAFITCPSYLCDTLVEDETVISLLNDERLKERYQLMVTNDFVAFNRLLRWCPKADCNRAIKVKSKYCRPVQCECQTVFCFDCGESWHETVQCHLFQKWVMKCEDKDAKETMNYICSYTKNCPNCQVVIEKNGGCNHMRCTKCSHDFCWMCLQKMKHFEVVAHRCNTYEASEKEKNVERCRAELKRFLFYCNRYANHQQSFKLEKKLMNCVQSKMTQLQVNFNMSWIEVQYLRKAVDILCKCRRTLMYTYVFAYFLQKSNQQAIFEDNQTDLENAVETLSGALEADLPEEDVQTHKRRILDLQIYCESRRVVLSKHVKEGYDKDWWQFHPNVCV